MHAEATTKTNLFACADGHETFNKEVVQAANDTSGLASFEVSLSHAKCLPNETPVIPYHALHETASLGGAMQCSYFSDSLSASTVVSRCAIMAECMLATTTIILRVSCVASALS